MKCQKCNYVGFDHLDLCANCGADLAEQKARFGINMPSYQRLDILAFLDGDKESGGDKTAVAAQGRSEGEQSGDFDHSEFGEQEGSAVAEDEGELDLSSGDLETGSLTDFRQIKEAPAGAGADVEIHDLDVETAPQQESAKPTGSKTGAELGGLDIELVEPDSSSESAEKKGKGKKKEEDHGLDIELDDLHIG
jgi:hypothetical protein